MQKSKIIEKVREAGIVGAGGGGFPTHVKIQAEVKTVIANGAECEPLLSTDKYLMENNAGDIIKGLRYIKQCAGAQEVYIALKRKYEKAVKEFKLIIGETSDIKLALLDNYYPAGDEFDVVYNVTGKIIPEGGLPLDVGCVVINVNTLLNVKRALDDSSPVTDRWITVSGEVEKPYIASVPIGISASELIKEACVKIKDYRLLAGGPMMGVPVEENYRVTKTCSGIIVLPENHSAFIKQDMTLRAHKKRGKSICDQCFDCTIVCPRNLLGHSLEPHRIMRNLFIADENISVYTPSFLCSQCGLCNMFACPMDLSPRNLLKETSDALSRRGVKNPHKKRNLKPHPEREYRKVNASRLSARIGVDKYEKEELPVKSVLPGAVRINLSQHAGTAALPVVKEGDSVKRGQLIGEIPRGKLGARVHSSISGKVKKVTSGYIEINKGENK